MFDFKSLFQEAKVSTPSFQGYVSFDCGQQKPLVYPLDSEGLAVIQSCFSDPVPTRSIKTLNGRIVFFSPLRFRSIRLFNDSRTGLQALAEQGEDDGFGYFETLLSMLSISLGDFEKVCGACPQLERFADNARNTIKRFKYEPLELAKKLTSLRILFADGHEVALSPSDSLASLIAKCTEPDSGRMLVIPVNAAAGDQIFAAAQSRIAVYDLPQITLADYATLLRAVELSNA